MKARAALAVELDGRGHSVIRRLRSAAPLTLMPARPTGPGPAEVRLVNSAAAPLAGDDLELWVHVGPGAALSLTGVAATLALPGHRAGPSRFTVRCELAGGATLAYLPEPTVVTSRAQHEVMLRAELAAGAELHTREVLVLGREGECPGRLSSSTHISRAGHPVLRQTLEIGDAALDAGPATFAGHRVLATDLVIGEHLARPAGGDWWSLSPLAAGGSIATALADNAVTVLRRLEAACAGRLQNPR